MRVLQCFCDLWGIGGSLLHKDVLQGANSQRGSLYIAPNVFISNTNIFNLFTDSLE